MSNRRLIIPRIRLTIARADDLGKDAAGVPFIRLIVRDIDSVIVIEFGGDSSKISVLVDFRICNWQQDAARTRTLAARFDAANRTRELLRSTVRADLAVTEALLGWCA